jgi:hypothetical protein
MTETFDQLELLLPAMTTLDAAGFWVVRGRAYILARAEAMVETAASGGILRVDDDSGDIATLVAAARARGLTVTSASPGVLLLVIDGAALVGTLVPADHCQAVVSSNRALVEALAPDVASAARQADDDEGFGDWLSWEWEKQRRILHLDDRRHSA